MESSPASRIVPFPSMIERHAHNTLQERIARLRKKHEDLPPLVQKLLSNIDAFQNNETVITAAEGLSEAYALRQTLAEKHMVLEAAAVCHFAGDQFLASQYFDFCIAQYMREDLFILPDNAIDSELFWHMAYALDRTDILEKAVDTFTEDIASEIKSDFVFDAQTDTRIEKNNGFLALHALKNEQRFTRFYTESIVPYLKKFPNDIDFRSKAVALCSAYNRPGFVKSLTPDTPTEHTNHTAPVQPQRPTVETLRRTLAAAEKTVRTVSSNGTNDNNDTLQAIAKITAEKNFARTVVALAKEAAAVLQ